MQIPSQRQALNLMLILLIAIMLFHILVLIQVIPYTIVWAGKLKDIAEMRSFETVSILINTLLIVVLLFKAKYIQNNVPVKILNGIIWLFAMLFALNTIGNLFAKTKFELFVFTPLTLIFTLLCLRIVIEETNKKKNLM